MVFGSSLRAQGLSTFSDSVAQFEALRRTAVRQVVDVDALLTRAELGLALLPSVHAARPGSPALRAVRDDVETTIRRVQALVSPLPPRGRLVRARLLLSSTTALTRHASRSEFQSALEGAAAVHDSALMAQVHLELGYAAWRSHEALADRRLEVVPGSAIRSIKIAMQPSVEGEAAPQLSMKAIRDGFETSTQPLPRDVTGEADYQTALRHFQDAWRHDPRSCAAFGGLAMVLVTRDRWFELAQSAAEAEARCPAEHSATLARGLAAYKSGRSDEARAIFEQARAKLSAPERARLDDITRILPPADSARLIGAGRAAARSSFEQMYWLMADPVWSKEGNEAQLEFTARVVYADLRWSLPERGIRGAESPRGDIYVRYGPPEVVATFAPGYTPTAISGSMYSGKTTSVWAYSSGWMFVFSLSPSFGTARIAPDDKYIARRFADAQPVRWDNLAGLNLDTIPVAVYHFRETGDSLTALIAAPASLRGVQAPALLNSQLWIVSSRATVVAHDSTVSPVGSTMQWAARVDSGPTAIRVETTGPDERLVGRSVTLTGRPTGLRPRGTTMSDVVLAYPDAQRSSAPARWSDVQPRVITGPVRPGASVRLLWELYELGNRDGTARIETTVAVQRERGIAGRIVAEVIGGITSAVTRTEADDRLTLQFTSEVAARPVSVGVLDVDLGDTVPGRYRVSVTVRDLVTGAAFMRSHRLIIED
jgi:GWxTD domain-containing protein